MVIRYLFLTFNVESLGVRIEDFNTIVSQQNTQESVEI